MKHTKCDAVRKVKQEDAQYLQSNSSSSPLRRRKGKLEEKQVPHK